MKKVLLIRAKIVFIMKWDLKDLFKSDNDPQLAVWQNKVEEASYHFINKWNKRRDYLNTPKVLAEALAEYEAWVANYGTNDRACYYFWLRSEQEKNNPQVKAGLNKAKDLAIKIENDIQFFTLNLSKLAPDQQKIFLNDEKLKSYHHFLKRLFATGQYTKSDAEEKIINHLADTSYHRWVDMLEAMLAQEERKGKNLPTLLADCANEKTKVRTQAAEQVNNILAAWAPVAEHELNAVLEYKKNIDKIRGTKWPEELRLVSDDMSPEVVEAMLSTVEKNFDLAQRYYRLKAKMMGQKKISYFERSVTVGKIKQAWPYKQAVDLVQEQLTNLDKELGEIFADFIKNKQLDVYPQNGKTDGAFCAHHSSTLPTYILLNYANKWHDVKTLAHEVGHGINNELVRKNVLPIYFGTPTSTAEVASTFFEDIVLASARTKVSDKEKLALLMSKLDDEVATTFRQVAAYRFEQNLHQNFRAKGYLAKEEIGKLWQTQMKRYLGPAVDLAKGSENWWVYWSHFRQFFYVYTYASGLLIAKSLQAKVRADKNFINEVKKFLGAGLSKSPQEIFAELGLDITDKNFWQQGIDEFSTLLKETEKLYNVISGKEKRKKISQEKISKKK